ncbi:hypothetical protein LTR17_025002 [Elasticomyces elasticus]|nr:hypothetical protein LTR17_025002 [Elasticomyces elasticus]
MSAIYKALEALGKGGSLFVYADAAAKDIELASTVADLAKKKRIKVYPFLFPSDCSSNAGFNLLAEASGGQLFGLSDRSDAGVATTLVDTVVSANAVEIMSVDTSSLDGGSLKRRQDTSGHFVIPVDSAMTQLTFSLSGTAAKLQIKRPDSSSVSALNSDVTHINLSGGQLVTIALPAPGMWAVDVVINATYSLSVSGVSPLSLSSFQHVELRGRAGHQGFFPVNGTPPASSGATTIAQIDGNSTEATFEYRTSAGAVISYLKLTHGGGNADDPVASNVFYGNVTIPSSNFTVYVVGKDGAGAPFQRVLPARFIYTVSNGTDSTNTTTPCMASLSSSDSASLTSMSASPPAEYSTVSLNTWSKYVSHAG